MIDDAELTGRRARTTLCGTPFAPLPSCEWTEPIAASHLVCDTALPAQRVALAAPGFAVALAQRATTFCAITGRAGAFARK